MLVINGQRPERGGGGRPRQFYTGAATAGTRTPAYIIAAHPRTPRVRRDPYDIFTPHCYRGRYKRLIHCRRNRQRMRADGEPVKTRWSGPFKSESSKINGFVRGTGDGREGATVLAICSNRTKQKKRQKSHVKSNKKRGGRASHHGRATPVTGGESRTVQDISFVSGHDDKTNNDAEQCSGWTCFETPGFLRFSYCPSATRDEPRVQFCSSKTIQTKTQHFSRLI